MPSYGCVAYGPLLMKVGVLFIWKMRKRMRMMHEAPSMRMGLATAILPVSEPRRKRWQEKERQESWRDQEGDLEST